MQIGIEIFSDVDGPVLRTAKSRLEAEKRDTLIQFCAKTGKLSAIPEKERTELDAGPK